MIKRAHEEKVMEVGDGIVLVCQLADEREVPVSVIVEKDKVIVFGDKEYIELSDALSIKK